MKKIIILFIFIALFTANVEARVGIRALGMGGAFVSVADDPTAAYWNPAGLTQVDNSRTYLGLALDNSRRDDFNFDNQVFISSRNTPAGESAKFVMLLPPLGLLALLANPGDGVGDDSYEFVNPNSWKKREFSPLLKSDWGHDDRPKRPDDTGDSDDDEEEDDDDSSFGCGCLFDIIGDILFDDDDDYYDDDEDDVLGYDSHEDREEKEKQEEKQEIYEWDEEDDDEIEDFDESIGGYIITNTDRFTDYYPELNQLDKSENKSTWLNLSGGWRWRRAGYSLAFGINYRLYLMNLKLKRQTLIEEIDYDDKGYGFSCDISFLYATKYFRFGVISQDLLTTDLIFNRNQEDEWELEILKNTQPGIAIEPIEGTTLSFDVYNVFADGGSDRRQYCFGYEQWIGDIFAIRTGSYKKTMTLGASFRIASFQLDYAYLSDKTLHFDSDNNKFELLDKKDFANNTHLIGFSLGW